MLMSEEITTRLLKMVTDISEAVNRTAQDVAVMKAQQEERKEAQAKAIEEIKCIQRKQRDDIEDLTVNNWTAVFGTTPLGMVIPPTAKYIGLQIEISHINGYTDSKNIKINIGDIQYQRF